MVSKILKSNLTVYSVSWCQWYLFHVLLIIAAYFELLTSCEFVMSNLRTYCFYPITTFVIYIFFTYHFLPLFLLQFFCIALLWSDRKVVHFIYIRVIIIICSSSNIITYPTFFCSLIAFVTELLFLSMVMNFLCLVVVNSLCYIHLQYTTLFMYKPPIVEICRCLIYGSYVIIYSCYVYSCCTCGLLNCSIHTLVIN